MQLYSTVGRDRSPVVLERYQCIVESVLVWTPHPGFYLTQHVKEGWSLLDDHLLLAMVLLVLSQPQHHRDWTLQ